MRKNEETSERFLNIDAYINCIGIKLCYSASVIRILFFPINFSFSQCASFNFLYCLRIMSHEAAWTTIFPQFMISSAIFTIMCIWMRFGREWGSEIMINEPWHNNAVYTQFEITDRFKRSQSRYTLIEFFFPMPDTLSRSVNGTLFSAEWIPFLKLFFVLRSQVLLLFVLQWI